jgi:hypothetical protein
VQLLLQTRCLPCLWFTQNLRKCVLVWCLPSHLSKFVKIPTSLQGSATSSKTVYARPASQRDARTTDQHFPARGHVLHTQKLEIKFDHIISRAAHGPFMSAREIGYKWINKARSFPARYRRQRTQLHSSSSIAGKLKQNQSACMITPEVQHMCEFGCRKYDR